MTISEQIDEDYRKYALYVIQSRGIPNFYDSLTPVQRLILQNAPTTFKKTVGVVGEVFSTGLYHHGDSSMSKAICKLARPFACSEQIVLGDGFFGTPVNPAPSAPRYTQVKMAPKYKAIIEKYKDLNIFNEEGGHDWLHVDYPLGLSTHIVGIAVGYKSNILPRKPDDIVEYLEGKKSKRLKPYFIGFHGKITRINSLKSSWLIEGDIETDLKSRTFRINSISPLQKYKSFFDKLNRILDNSLLNYKIDNFSTEEVNIIIKFRCSDQEFRDISERLTKETKQVVTENIIFVKDGNVLEYSDISEYLDDFILHREYTFLKRFERDLQYLDDELAFLDAKLKFLIFMSEKKRAAEEVKKFLSQFNKKISKKLELLSLVKLTKDEILKTKDEIKLRKKDIKIKIKETKKQKERLKILNNEYKKLNKKSSRTMVLLDTPEDEYYQGIKIWNPEDGMDEDEELNELNELNEDE